MNNCPNCGTANKSTDKFCLNCGNKLEETPTSAESPTTIPANEMKRQRPPLKQRIKRMAAVISVALILAAGIGTHLFLQSKYDASKSIAAMNKAFNKNDPSNFFSYFSVPKDTAANEDAFYSFVEDEGWESLRDQLRAETRLLESEELSNIILDSNGNKFISVVSDPILFGLYDHITFLVHPITVQAEMPLDATSLVMGEKTVTGNKGETINAGKFIPGSYKWTASVESDYSPINTEGTADVYGDGSNTYLLSPDIAGGTLKITSDVADAVLWIDGKSTGKTVKEMNTIGPIPFNGSVEIAAETKDDEGKAIKGEAVAVESETAHINFAHIQEKAAAQLAKTQQSEELEELAEMHEYEASEFVTYFRSYFEDALNYGDFSYISEFFPPGSKVQSYYVEDIERHNEMDNYYNYDFESNVITGVKAIDNKTLQVTTDETFLFTSDEDTIRFYRTKLYTVEILDYGYYITDIEQLTSEQNSI